MESHGSSPQQQECMLSQPRQSRGLGPARPRMADASQPHGGVLPMGLQVYLTARCQPAAALCSSSQVAQGAIPGEGTKPGCPAQRAPLTGHTPFCCWLCQSNCCFFYLIAKDASAIVYEDPTHSPAWHQPPLGKAATRQDGHVGAELCNGLIFAVFKHLVGWEAAESLRSHMERLPSAGGCSCRGYYGDLAGQTAPSQPCGIDPPCRAGGFLVLEPRGQT